jgi:RNA polymerase sigma-70 factor (ECF subfamily)
MQEQFSEIFREQEQPLYTLALRLTKSDEVAKDIVQEVFMKLWEYRNNIHAIRNMQAWLYKLTENKIIDFLRKASADDRLKKKIWDQVQQLVNETELHLEAKEYNGIIQKAIERLPPQSRLIYELNKERGMNYQQIATELQLSKHTVKNQLFSAVQAVRRFLAKSAKIFLVFFVSQIGIIPLSFVI